MDPRKLFFDDRMKGICAYCGGLPDSRDHVPSKILLDEPYPKNLPIAESCTSCNQSFSASEEYVACLIESAINGTTIPNENFRPKIATTLNARPSIAKRIEEGKQVSSNGQLIWQPEAKHVKKVMLKLARGHMAYELGIQHIEEPELIEILPLAIMSEAHVEEFLTLPDSHTYPEIGSRAFVNLHSGKLTAFENWHVVQNNRYLYALGQSEGDWVKILINEYLAVHIAWN